MAASASSSADASPLTAASALAARARRSLRWRPEWRLVALIAAAWLALALLGTHGASDNGLADAHAHHGAHAHDTNASSLDLASAIPLWALMSLAMMAPASLPAVRHVALNSVRRRRQRAMAEYAGAYLGVWTAFGLMALLGVELVRRTSGIDDGPLLALVLLAAAGWQLTRWKRRAIYACRRTLSLPPHGLAADAGCLRFGAVQGARGVRSCWALMATMAVLGHASLAWMAALTALVLVEEQTLVGRRLLVPSAAALVLAAFLEPVV